MRIIIVGCGKVGYAIARNLSGEKDADLTVIDIDHEALEKASETIDAIITRGNGLSAATLCAAGVREADLLVSVTHADEINILCCVAAKRLGVRHTIARVRNPEVVAGLDPFWEDLGLDMIINPELEAAREISRLLRFPTADDIDVFVGGRVELVSFSVNEAPGFFVGKSVAEIFSRRKLGVLLAVVERGNSAIIPHGELIFEPNDVIRMLGRPADIMDFFPLIGKSTDRIKNTVIVGAGRITYYLVNMLQKHSAFAGIKIIELDKGKCEELNEAFPRCMIINGDGTDESILLSEGIDRGGAIVCLTNRDEENAIIALYARHMNMRKVIVKINHINANMVKNLGLGSIISPANITCDQVVRYVRGLSNAVGNNIKAVYTIYDGDGMHVEAVEFAVTAPARCLDTPLKDLRTRLRKGVLIGCIVRGSHIIIPTGATSMHMGDSVIIIARNEDILELDDVLAF